MRSEEESPKAEALRMETPNQLIRIASLFRNKKAAFGLALFALMALPTVIAPWIAPFDPDQQVLSEVLLPPLSSGERGTHLLGTDHLGRDMLSRIIWGGRISIMIGILAVLGSGTIGLLIGLTSGFYGRWLDAILMRLAEIQLSFPSLLIIFVVLAIIGPSIVSIAVVLSITSWVHYARIARGRILSEKELEYTLAALAIGASNARIMFRHLLPNIIPVVMVFGTLQLGSMIIVESGLSFLGIGVQPPTSSWGRMLSDGQAYMMIGWWVATIPGLAIVLTVLAVNFLGDGLRQAMHLE